MNRSVSLIAPYAAWMVLMTVLPQTAWAYAVRGFCAALLLIAGWFGAEYEKKVRARESRYSAEVPEKELSIMRRAFIGLFVGLVVFAIWIAPDFIFTPAALEGASPYDPTICGWSLTIAKLCASAFVISIAEELFFRVWLVEFAGFWWMVVLFAVEHGERWHVGAITGILYGLLAKRFGIFAAIAAHATTNFLLGLYVIIFDKWFYW